VSSPIWRARPLFGAEHDDFRRSVQTYAQRHVTPHLERWDEVRMVDRDAWTAAGDGGLLGLGLPEWCGGSGDTDYRFRAVLIEELMRVGATAVCVGFTTHTDITLPYLADLAAPEIASRWLPGLLEGSRIGAIAMTEPGTGSDLRGIRTVARRDGDDWVLSGSKTFISNGIQADLVVVVARTEDHDGPADGLSLFVVEREVDGFTRGRQLRKVGLHAQDTAELQFDGVRLGADSLLGEEGRAMTYLKDHLAYERLGTAVTSCAGARAAIQWTVDYVSQRAAFGQRIADFQNTRFVLADLVTSLDVVQAYVDHCVVLQNTGDLDSVTAAKAKLAATEMHKAVVDSCLQLHGGYGYMEEYPIARAFLDTRVATIYGGTSEIMKVIIGADLLAPS
jgi:long-chain-acyl-CoA dehydrogenase